MSDYSNHVRRKDRQEKDPAFLRSVLTEAIDCSIAIEKVGYPLIHVAFFLFDEARNEIIFHFSKHGHASEEITNGKRVCVSVYKHGQLYTADKAVDFGCEYQSLIIYGNIQIVEDEAERLRDMTVFFDRFFNHIDKSTYKGFTEQEAKPITVARIKIVDWFGKEHRVPENATGSFYFGGKAVL
jgi:nitroimidazol reductase NimA-like FMN-containing flavoprotein (pyridoxamine 5'-phosphate oxidase superfamily)